MPRSLLALCLFLFTATAMAGTAVASDDSTDAPVRPGKAAATERAQDGNATVGGNPAATPARSGTTHAVTPRWHSLLPGMIR